MLKYKLGKLLYFKEKRFFGYFSKNNILFIQKKIRLLLGFLIVIFYDERKWKRIFWIFREKSCKLRMLYFSKIDF